MAIDHIWLAVLINPKGSIQSRFIRRQIDRVLHGHIRPIRMIAHQDVRRATFYNSPFYGIDRDLTISERSKVKIPVFVFMEFGRPDHWMGSHPGLRIDLYDLECTIPKF